MNMVPILYPKALLYALMIVTMHLPAARLMADLGYRWLRTLYCL